MNFHFEIFTFLRFCVVGLLNTLLTAGLIFGLSLLSFDFVSYTLISYGIGIIVGYFLHRRFSFRYQAMSNADSVKRFMRYLVISIVLLGAVLLLQSFLIESLGWNEYLSGGLGIIFYSGTGFLLNRFFVFRSLKQGNEPCQASTS